MAPKIGPKSFGGFEKRTPSRTKRSLTTWNLGQNVFNSQKMDEYTMISCNY